MIIGVSGKKRSGKDTVFRVIRKIAGIYAERAAFGDQIKEEVAGITGMDLEHIEENKEHFRPILQWWGADFRRRYNGESYWLDKMRNKLKRYRSGGGVLVITDVRFPNEADLVKAVGGIMLRVDRDTGLNDVHSSENELDSFRGFDYRLSNNGTLDDLEAQVEPIVAEHCCIAPAFRAASLTAAVAGA